MYKPKEETSLEAYEAEQERIDALLPGIRWGLEVHANVHPAQGVGTIGLVLKNCTISW